MWDHRQNKHGASKIIDTFATYHSSWDDRAPAILATNAMGTGSTNASLVAARALADRSASCTTTVLRPKSTHAGLQHNVPDTTVLQRVVHGLGRFCSHDRKSG